MNGKPITIGGQQFTVPRLRVGPYERAMTAVSEAEKIDQAKDPFGFARLTATCGALVELLKENHPDLTVEAMKEIAHMDDLGAVLAGVLSAAGKPAGEAVSP